MLTENQLIEALREALEQTSNEEGYMTMGEICDALGKNQKSMALVLKGLKTQGRLAVSTVSIETLSGRMTKVPAYKLI